MFPVLGGVFNTSSCQIFYFRGVKMRMCVEWKNGLWYVTS